MEKLKQTVFLKKLVDGRYYILNSQKMYQPLPKSWKHNNFNVGKKSCTGVGVNLKKKNLHCNYGIFFYLVGTPFSSYNVILNRLINHDILIFLA